MVVSLQTAPDIMHVLREAMTTSCDLLLQVPVIGGELAWSAGCSGMVGGVLLHLVLNPVSVVGAMFATVVVVAIYLTTVLSRIVSRLNGTRGDRDG